MYDPVHMYVRCPVYMICIHVRSVCMSCMYVSVCMYVCMYVCMCVCVCVCVCVFTHTNTHTHTHTHTHTQTYTHTRHTHSLTHSLTHRHACMHENWYRLQYQDRRHDAVLTALMMLVIHGIILELHGKDAMIL